MTYATPGNCNSHERRRPAARALHSSFLGDDVAQQQGGSPVSAFGRTTGSAMGNVGNTGRGALPGALPRVQSKPSVQAVTPLRVVDFTLAQALGHSPAGADTSIPDLLHSLQTQTPPAVAGGWRVYLQTPLARLYERQTGQGGFAHGMGAMLVLPARGLEAFRGAECSVFAADTAQVIGASLPDAAGSGTKRLPQLYGFDATRLETDWRPPRERHWQAMSLPLLLPGWRAVPGQGLYAGRQALVAHEGSAEPTLAGWNRWRTSSGHRCGYRPCAQCNATMPSTKPTLSSSVWPNACRRQKWQWPRPRRKPSSGIWMRWWHTVALLGVVR